MHYSKIYNLNSTSLRFFNVYGPNHLYLKLYGAVFEFFFNKISIFNYSCSFSGKQTRDFTYFR